MLGDLTKSVCKSALSSTTPNEDAIVDNGTAFQRLSSKNAAGSEISLGHGVTFRLPEDLFPDSLEISEEVVVDMC